MSFEPNLSVLWEHLIVTNAADRELQARYESQNRMQLGSETDPFTVERYRQFARRLPSGACDVLDIGCNTGRGGAALKARAASVHIVGLDCVPERVAALDAAVYVDARVGLTTELPFEDCTFDAVLAGEFLEHLYPKDVDVTLSEFLRVLRVGGRLLLTTPNPNDLKRRVRGGTVLGGAHVSQHRILSMKRRLRATGFSRIRVFGSGKTSRYLGSLPVGLSLFGSYLLQADKK
jgi:SAM-dependent methyltransferase